MPETQAHKTQRATGRQPKNLQDWRQKLSRLSLVVDDEVRREAISVLRSDYGNAEGVADILVNDPPQCALLLSATNALIKNEENKIQTLPHALSILGFPRVEALLREPPGSNEKPLSHAQQYQQSLTVSLHAAHQAAAWSEYNSSWQRNEIFWSTLVHNAPLWALWVHAGPAMEELVILHEHGKRDPALITSLFGTDLINLGSLLVEDWHLPSACQNSWAFQKLMNRKELLQYARLSPTPCAIRPALESMPQMQTMLFNNAFPVWLGNMLANEADWCWLSPKTLRIMKLFSVATAMPLDQTIQRCHQHAVAFAKSQTQQIPENSRGQYCASQLLSLPNRVNLRRLELVNGSDVDSPENKSNSEPTSVTAEKPQSQIDKPTPNPESIEVVFATAEAEPATPEAFLKGLTALQDNNLTQLNDILMTGAKALAALPSVHRLAVMMTIPKTQTIKTLLAHGCNDSPALKQFRNAYTANDMFGKLFSKPISLRLNADNHAKIWPKMPGNFKQAVGFSEEFFMMSVFAGKRPIALFYVDNGDSHQPMSNADYQHFKTLCSAVSARLTKLSTPAK